MPSFGYDEELALGWHAWAFRYALYLTGNADRAADLSQDAMVRALARKPADLPAEAFRSWLRTVMVRLEVDHHRRLFRERTALRRLAADAPGPSIEAPTASPVLNALEDLTPRQRACFVLRYFDDLPEAEVAHTLGMRQGTVKAHLNRARESLRLRLGPLRELSKIE